MAKQLRPAITMLVIFTVLTGVIYPLLVTLISQAVFPVQANGSLISAINEDRVIGSSLIGQANSDPIYFWGRPSAIGYNPLPSSGSNLTLTNAAFLATVAEREAAFREANGVPPEVAVPMDMIYASASGLDPHISPDGARFQIDRVAAARGVDRQQIADAVERAIEAPQLGILGDPRVNVLLLNNAIDGLTP